MNKFFSPKILGKLLVVFAVLIFLWIMSSTVSPIKPHRLEKYLACDVNNISSWGSTGGDLTVNSFKSSYASSNHIEFIYQHPPTQLGQPEFWCKFSIPEMILYRAITLSVTYKLNQPSLFTVGMRRVGMGPAWEPRVVDSDNANKIITSTWLLDNSQQPKSNWLSGPYEEVTFGVSKFDPNKELILTIYQVYLE